MYQFDLSGKRAEGELYAPIKIGAKTCLIKFKNEKGEYDIIKRHLKKHNVVETKVEVASCVCDTKCEANCACESSN